jgi:hypothetical protein
LLILDLTASERTEKDKDMPKAALTDDEKKRIAEKYENAGPTMTVSALSKWATKDLGKPVTARVCKSVVRTTKRDQGRASS